MKYLCPVPNGEYLDADDGMISDAFNLDMFGSEGTAVWAIPNEEITTANLSDYQDNRLTILQVAEIFDIQERMVGGVPWHHKYEKYRTTIPDSSVEAAPDSGTAVYVESYARSI